MKLFFSFVIFSLLIPITVGWKHQSSRQYMKAIEYFYDKCFGFITDEEGEECCTNFCQKESQCYLGKPVNYTFTKPPAELCLCYLCKGFKNFKIQNRVINLKDQTIIIDFPYCTQMFPFAANDYCQRYCEHTERCKSGKCAKSITGEALNRCVCQTCSQKPSEDPEFLAYIPE